MGSLFFSVLIILCISKDAAKSSVCTSGTAVVCPLLSVDFAQICYTKFKSAWNASLTCNTGRLKGPETYTCSTVTYSWTPTFASSCVSTDSQQTTFVPTSIHTTEKDGDSNNTTMFTGKTPGPSVSEDSGSGVVAAVSVSIVVVIAVGAVVVLFLWRRRRWKHQNATGGNSGTLVSNRGNKDDQGLDRHISLLDMRPDDSVENEYAEISPENLNVEEAAGSVYQTIDVLPKDQTASTGDYGHLKIQSRNVINNNYSHVAVDQPSHGTSMEPIYSHTGEATNAQELKNDSKNDLTYNHLETIAGENKGNTQMLKKEETEAIEEMDTEYNHAKAGHRTVVIENENDSYTHLIHKPQANQLNDFSTKFHSPGSKSHTNDPGLPMNKPHKLDPENKNDRNSTKQFGFGCDGYEMPTGKVNTYFTLEPECKNTDTGIPFKVTTQMLEEQECEEPFNHQYSILEKMHTDTTS